MRNHFIRTTYLYIFALTGLTLLVIGTVQLVNLGLKTFVFTKADEQYNYASMPPMPMMMSPTREISEEDFVSAIEQCEGKCDLTDEQENQIAQWLRDYRQWQNEPKVDYRTQQRHRESALAASLILVGLPLYLYHWRTIKKEKEAASSS